MTKAALSLLSDNSWKEPASKKSGCSRCRRRRQTHNLASITEAIRTIRPADMGDTQRHGAAGFSFFRRSIFPGLTAKAKFYKHLRGSSSQESTKSTGKKSLNINTLGGRAVIQTFVLRWGVSIARAPVCKKDAQNIREKT
jgi:hypothetical protein